ncbi:hypothetical protein ACFYVL_31700 [Streptomyces sp. NPDC004111]|uniref:hypothetical protein n=1 Tax=Streptomyces sp. NPDC004111 TaxID=3364690 RepID=UPI0036CC6DBE
MFRRVPSSSVPFCRFSLTLRSQGLNGGGAMTGNGGAEGRGYEGALRELGVALTELKRERGAPSYRQLRSRGARVLGAEWAVSLASMSEIFAGRRGPSSLNRLLWLVRTLLSYDDGEEVQPPERRDPRLEPWRERWNAIEALRAAARRSPAVSAAAETEDPAAVPAALPASQIEAALSQMVDFVSAQAHAGASPVATMLIAGGTVINWLDEWLRSQTVLHAGDMAAAALHADDERSALLRAIVARHEDAVRAAPHAPDQPGSAGGVQCFACYHKAAPGQTGIWSCDHCGAYNDTNTSNKKVTVLDYKLPGDLKCSACGLFVNSFKVTGTRCALPARPAGRSSADGR